MTSTLAEYNYDFSQHFSTFFNILKTYAKSLMYASAYLFLWLNTQDLTLWWHMRTVIFCMVQLLQLCYLCNRQFIAVAAYLVNIILDIMTNQNSVCWSHKRTVPHLPVNIRHNDCLRWFSTVWNWLLRWYCNVNLNTISNRNHGVKGVCSGRDR